jgi:hypothetical protein
MNDAAGESASRDDVPRFGIVYGEIVYWLAIVGMVVGIIGVTMHLRSPGSEESSSRALDALWAGGTASEIWGPGVDTVSMGHWYLDELSTGNGLAMLGVAMCCASAVFGLFGGCIAMFRSKGRERPLYMILAVVVLVLLSLSVMGIASG